MWSSVSTTLYMNNCHDITGPWLCPLCGNYDGEYRVESVRLAMLKLFWSQSAFGSHKCNSGTRQKPELTEPYRNNSLSFNFHNTKVKFSSWLTVTENATKYVRFRRLCSSESLDLVTFVLFVSPWLFFFLPLLVIARILLLGHQAKSSRNSFGISPSYVKILDERLYWHPSWAGSRFGRCAQIGQWYIPSEVWLIYCLQKNQSALPHAALCYSRRWKTCWPPLRLTLI